MLYRRVTRACAASDWKAETHDQVLAKHKGNHLLQRFINVKTSLDYCHAGDNVMDRSRDCDGAGPHILGNFHIKAPEARRAWLWRDTGELDPIGTITTIDWMVAEGARRRGDATDLQNVRRDLLCDPEDKWLPTEDDYIDLVEVHDAGWLDRARDAVRTAVAKAKADTNELVHVDLEKANAAVAQAGGIPIEVKAGVIDEFSERWFYVERLREDGTLITYEEALALMSAAMEGAAPDDIEELFESTVVNLFLNEQMIIEPAKHYAWLGIISEH